MPSYHQAARHAEKVPCPEVRLDPKAQPEDTRETAAALLEQLLINIDMKYSEEPKREQIQVLVREARCGLREPVWKDHGIYMPLSSSRAEPNTRHLRDAVLCQCSVFKINKTNLECEQMRNYIPGHDLLRTESLWDNMRLKDWISRPSSRVLLILGRFEIALERHLVSGLTYLCRSLLLPIYQSQVVYGAQRLYYLAFYHSHYYCHGGPAEHLEANIINAFLTQLSQQGIEPHPTTQRFPPKCLPKETFTDRLFYFFLSILWRLPPDSVVVCVIDGVDLSEVPHDRQRGCLGVWDSAGLIGKLLELVDARHMSCIFKLLLTSTTPTTKVKRYFEKHSLYDAGTESIDHSDDVIYIPR